MTNIVLDRIVTLASRGYNIRFTPFFSKDAIEILVIKNNLRAAQVVTIEEIERSKFEVVLYAINRLANLVDA